jgi:hypothetical protein
MAWSREINAEHFVGVNAGSQIGAMGPGITAVGATADFTPRQLIIVFGPGGWRAEGELWVAELCARAAGSEIIAAPQSYPMFSTGSP